MSMSTNNFRLPDGSAIRMTDWTEGDCTFAPDAHVPRAFAIDLAGDQPGDHYGGADCVLGASAEWLVRALTIIQESETVKPRCWLELIVSNKICWRLDVASHLLPLATPASRIELFMPIHIGGQERFRLQQSGEDENKLSVTLHILKKSVY